MEDEKIIALFFSRSEAAISETQKKYGAYAAAAVKNILCSAMDAEECLNDALLKLWNSIPPKIPESLKFYFTKIARNTALDRYRAGSAAKCGGTEELLTELEDCVSKSDVEGEVQRSELICEINAFLRTLSARDRGIFLHRYFFVESISETAAFYSVSAAHAKVILSRTRKKLKEYLKKRGY